MDAGGGIVERHGVYQPRVPVRAGVAYQGYLWLKTTGYDGRIVVALEEDLPGGQTYAEAEIRGVEGDWKKYAFTLRPARTDTHARLAFLFEGKGRVWVDQVSLLPGDAVGGVRADVEARVAALRPAFLRWPGGNVAQDYHWTWGVGPRDQRPIWVNLSWKNEPEPGDIGTDEFIALSRRVGAEPSITVNVEGRGATAEEAAAWVEYCNGPATSRYGAMRAANGHPEPYGVKYWELGNEIWGDWVRGHSDAATYARNYVRYAQAMRAVDPDDPAHRRRRQRHELEPHRAADGRPVHRLPGDPPLLRAQGDGRGRAQPDGPAAPLRALLPGGREGHRRRGARPSRSGSPSTSGDWTCPRPASTRWKRRSTGRGS